MITIREAGERGVTRIDWLDSRHSFSFGDYHDPEHMGFRALRVINDDRIAAGGGFGMHPHRDMEILTFVLDGALEHRDSLGHKEALRPGEVQRMSAGTGIWHSEYNASQTAPVHLFQIWIQPDQRGVAPAYEQKRLFADGERGMRLAAGPAGSGALFTIHQDAEVYQGRLEAGAAIDHVLPAGRHAWLQVMRGTVHAGARQLRQGDAAVYSGEEQITARAEEASDVLLFVLK
ncbi:MAG: pirin family protein [Gemmataceae bacterium]